MKFLKPAKGRVASSSKSSPLKYSDGTGYHPSKWVEHTPEYLEKKRIKDEAKRKRKIRKDE